MLFANTKYLTAFNMHAEDQFSRKQESQREFSLMSNKINASLKKRVKLPARIKKPLYPSLP